MLSGVAVIATGTAVGLGMLTTTATVPPRQDGLAISAAVMDAGGSAAGSVAAGGSVVPAEPEVATAGRTADRRRAPVSRSDRRGVTDPFKQAALALDTTTEANAITRTEDVSDEDPRAVASLLVGDATQFGCLDSLWTKESNWRVSADNPSSSAYGIPQALPGSKMSTFGDDWATNPVTQIRWGLDYIANRYSTPCGAWSHSVSHGWY